MTKDFIRRAGALGLAGLLALPGAPARAQQADAAPGLVIADAPGQAAAHQERQAVDLSVGHALAQPSDRAVAQPASMAVTHQAEQTLAQLTGRITAQADAPPAARLAQAAATQSAPETPNTASTNTGQTPPQIDLLFGTAHMAALPPGAPLDYTVRALRTDSTSGETRATTGHIALATAPGADDRRRDVEAVLTRDGTSRSLPPFQSVEGNPVLIIFLEQVLQDLSRDTGGSSFYLRNRMRDGMARGMQVETRPDGTRLVMRPLAGDPNTAALGDYTNLEISLLLDDSLPGMFARLSAVAGPADAPVFVEEVSLDVES
ncbi:hypothetical protein [Marinibacterium sp. SX1]|uniref:hypothetical protein n=1 Tax=Marinibacterium sp. SX1 TaxID=3388424 RepID=UPI003D184EDA